MAATCPICGAPTRAGSPLLPFCSGRCKKVDLGRWLDGEYRISTPLGDDDTTDLPEPPEPTLH